MIEFLTYKTIEDYNSSGVMGLVFSVRDAVPFSFEGLLLALFILIFGGQYFVTKSRTGRAKVLIALVSSSFIMVLLSILLALAQLVDIKIVVFYAFLLIISFAFLLISDSY